ncbi:DUF916 and DUF3324 domain-containing protein [Enterococcus sp. AZ196]|uniref:DUF916 and DUF3324 domain-containing protein n=1 Tax=Enterococcus sp. AZ196 TaxID=2774659 RepID=UPI003D29BF0F
MKNKKKFYKLCFLLLVLFLLPSGITHAEKTTTSDNDETTETRKQAGFQVQSVLPENQINDRVSYYHLLVHPGQTQTIELKIMNNSPETQHYTVEVIRAATNKNGLITYDERDKRPDESMRLPITDVAQPRSNEVSVKSYSEGKAEIDLSIPNDQPFEGILLGGIRVSLKEGSTEDSETGLSVKNTYGYAIGMVLTEDEKNSIYGEPELKLTTVKPEVNYGSKILEASIQNPEPVSIKDATVEGKIISKRTNKSVAEGKLKNVSIAPNSVFPFHIDWGMNQIVAGEYTLKGIARIGDKKWQFEQNFTISSKIAKKMNEQTVFKIIIPDWWMHTAYILIMVTVGVLVFLIVRLVKRTKGRKSNEA